MAVVSQPIGASSGALLLENTCIYQIFGANTDVGKTVCSTVLCKAARELFTWRKKTGYLKPVSTGPETENDTMYVLPHVKTFVPSIDDAKTLHQYELPVSPHMAAEASKKKVPLDKDLLSEIRDHAGGFQPPGTECAFLFVETAGGVHSPGPSGTTQADLYAPLRLPVILIGDAKLGGISQTISAFESLRLRGYDIKHVMIFKEETYQNYKYLFSYFKRHSTTVFAIPHPPSKDHLPVEGDTEQPGSSDANSNMSEYYEHTIQDTKVSHLMNSLQETHLKRVERLRSMAADASKRIWYPFTQHMELSPETINVIDSALGDYFQTLHKPSEDTPDDRLGLLRSSFDASASWWTQGLGHGSPTLTLAAAYAAGRYGHVIFPGAIHEPALALANSLVTLLKNPRLTRVFFSDNGSTGVEVAVKMALRAARLRYDRGVQETLSILGLEGSYHGDTIGAMDCADPCSFNQKVEWYVGRGFWFECPTVLCTDGQWTVSIPETIRKADDASVVRGVGVSFRYNSLAEIFDLKSRDESAESALYQKYIVDSLAQQKQNGRKFGALILEPVVLGAGGMKLVDPLFQRTLVNIVRESPELFGKANKDVLPATRKQEESTSSERGIEWSGLPVIFDEVFTGLFRLGRSTAASFLGVNPDISVHAKLLTGGLLPLCVTLASEDIFESFKGKDKSDALLHGHSYTAHPIGCNVALKSVEIMQSMEAEDVWNWAQLQNGWPSSHGYEAWSVWSGRFVTWLSSQNGKGCPIKGVWALGTVLAIYMDGEGGYTSKAATDLQAALLNGTDGLGTGTGSLGRGWNMHSRVLGNVLYVMASLKTTITAMFQVEDFLKAIIRSMG